MAMAMCMTPFTREEYESLMAGLNFHVEHVKKGVKRQADCGICQMQTDAKGA